MNTSDTHARNYVATAMADLYEQRPNLDPAVARLYTLLALTKGKATTLADVHDAWAVWRNDTRPDHPDLLPFEQIPAETQEWDRPFMQAIHAASAAPETSDPAGPGESEVQALAHQTPWNDEPMPDHVLADLYRTAILDGPHGRALRAVQEIARLRHQVGSLRMERRDAYSRAALAVAATPAPPVDAATTEQEWWQLDRTNEMYRVIEQAWRNDEDLMRPDNWDQMAAVAVQAIARALTATPEETRTDG